MPIRYVPQAAIDREKWNACIDAAGGHPFYAYDFYLDAMSRHWDALVLNDYEAVMPLTWNRKWGFYYLYQPFLTPELGIISKKIDAEIVNQFLSAVPAKFKFWEINLNRANDFPLPGFPLKRQLNYVLPVPDYATAAARYRQNHVRNIKKAVRAGCVYREGIAVEDVLRLAKAQLRQYTVMQKDDLANFHRLCTHLLKNRKAKTVGIYRSGELLASAVFFSNEQTSYYILAGNAPAGRPVGASHFLLDRFIEQQAGENRLLDFTGSSIASVAHFYEGFGAAQMHYPSVRLNRLPPLIRRLKK